MIRQIITIAAIPYVLYQCAKHKEEKYRPARVLSYIGVGGATFGIIGKQYFYHSAIYPVGLFGMLLSFFLIGAYFAWKRRDEPGMKMVLYTVGAFFLLLAFAVLAFYFDVFSYFFPE